MQETWVRSLGQEDPLEKKMATIPVLLPGKSQGQRSLVGYSHKESDATKRLNNNTVMMKLILYDFLRLYLLPRPLDGGVQTVHWLTLSVRLFPEP